MRGADPIRFCQCCEQPFVRNSSQHRVCPSCRRKITGRRAPKPKPCTHCGVMFATTYDRQRFCSDNCRTRWHLKHKRTNDGKCGRCGTQTDPHNSNCEPCRRQAKRNAKRRRTARQRGLKTEPYTLAEIAKRDRYRCGLCGRKVNMNLTVPHDRAPTRDHIVPTSQGGDDVKANVQLAHFICNSLKRDRGEPQQLLLVG